MEKNKAIYWQSLKVLFANKLKVKIFVLLFGLTMSNMQVALADSQVKESKRTVTGVVKDESGEPIPGVSVVIKGTTTGTITDFDGVYKLQVSESAAILVYSFVGMQNQEIALGNKKLINVVMKSADLEIEEISVIAYGTKKKVTITGAISSMDNKELVKMPVASVTNMLAGNVTGVSAVQYSGQPGSDDAQIYVRGIANPLVLVDGVERSFSQIDPSEIADLTVLKDASSTAVFGVRGANGVILITTRRGQEGAPKISISSSYGVQVPTSLGEYVNAKDYMTYVNEANINDGGVASYPQSILDIYDDPNRNKLLYPDTDWQKMFYDDYASQHKQNVNISGGTKNVRYFTSVGMFSQNGLFNGNDNLDFDGAFTYKRYNLRANLDIDVTKSTLVSLNIGGRLENRNEPGAFKQGEFFRAFKEANPLGGAGIVDGKAILNNPDILPDGNNALDFYRRGITNSAKNILNLDFKLKQELDFITKGLNVSLKGSYNSTYYQNKNRKTTRPLYTPYIRKDIPWPVVDVPTTPEEENEIILIKDGDYGATTYSESSGRGRNFYTELALNYKQSFGGHNVSGLLMYNARRNYYPKSFPDLPNAYVGMVGRATYDYDTRYLLDFSIGYNGSENFHPDIRYGVFPSTSVGWIITEEEFLKGNPVVDYLKLRASYGVVGRDNAPRFMYLPDSYNFGGGYRFGGVSGGTWQDGAREGTINNETTSWEQAYKQNYGVDMRFFDSKLSVYFDYFIENRVDRLIRRSTLPGYIAFTPPTVNLGERENKGMELSLGWKGGARDFKYNITVNSSYSKYTEVYFDEVPNEDNPWTLRTGHPVGQPFGYDVLGFYQEGMLNNNGVDAKEVQPALNEGDVVYADTNGDGSIDSNDKIAIGYSNNPLFTAGVNMGFEWKNLSFSMAWTGATGVSRELGGAYREPLGLTGGRSLMQEQFDNRWTPETAETATLPRASMTSLVENSKLSSLWIKDASYARLKNIRIGYTIRSQAVKNLGIESANIFAAGQNILTFDKLGLLDPESRTQGLSPAYPLMQVYNVGVNLTF